MTSILTQTQIRNTSCYGKSKIMSKKKRLVQWILNKVYCLIAVLFTFSIKTTRK